MARAGCAASVSSLTVCCNAQPRKSFDSAHSTTQSKNLTARCDGGVSARNAFMFARAVPSSSLPLGGAVRALDMGYPFAGKVALDTGATLGIGQAIVDALGGAGERRVAAAARRISALGPLVDRHGSRVVPLQLDV